MKGSRLSLLGLNALAALAAASLVSGNPMPSAGFTRGSHTTRRRTDPVRRMGPNPDPEIAAWNRAVDQRKTERKRGGA